MITQINGIEITPNMAEVLNEWYSDKIVENTQPSIYFEWLSEIQDYLTRDLTDTGYNEKKFPILIECLDTIIQIKDDFKKLIPEKDEQ